MAIRHAISLLVHEQVEVVVEGEGVELQVVVVEVRYGEEVVVEVKYVGRGEVA